MKPSFLCAPLLLSAWVSGAAAQDSHPLFYLADTFAGKSYTESGRPAIDMRFKNPESIAFGPNGDLYLSDARHYRLIRIDRQGRAFAIAGSTIQGTPDDGEPAGQSLLRAPGSLAVNSKGEIYFVDGIRILKIDLNGIISTVAGNGPKEQLNDGGSALFAGFTLIGELAFDRNDNLLIADREHRRIRSIDPSGRISTIAGNGSLVPTGDGCPAIAAAIGDPFGLTVSPQGDIYFTGGGVQVRLIDGFGVIHTVLGSRIFGTPQTGIPATDSAFRFLRTVTLDAQGNLYVAGEHRIFKVPAATGILEAVAGSDIKGFRGDGGPARNALLNVPASLTIDSTGALYFADLANHRIRVIRDGRIDTLYGRPHLTGDGGPATEASFKEPQSILLAPDGSMYVSDRLNNVVRKIDPEGIVERVAGTGEFGVSGDGGRATNAQLAFPADLVMDSRGDLYIADQSNRVRVVDRSGTIRRFAGGGTVTPGDQPLAATQASIDVRGLAFDENDNLYIASHTRVYRVTPDGVLTTFAGTGEAGFSGDGSVAVRAQLNTATAVAVGPDRRVYISDSGNNRIRAVGGDGRIRPFAGGGFQFPGSAPLNRQQALLSFPSEMSFDSEGTLFFLDSIFKLHRIDRKSRAAHARRPRYA
ncbi:MAG: hypothetical protein WD733_08290 [Bryobacterales bacterium]